MENSGISDKVKSKKLKRHWKCLVLLTPCWSFLGWVVSAYALPKFSKKGHKLNRRKDIRNILLKKKGLKTTKPETLNLPPGTKIYINERLCPYYKKLQSICKTFWNNELVFSFWVNNGSVRVKFSTTVFIITHISDLEEPFPANPILHIS